MNCPYCNNSKSKVVHTASWLENEVFRVRVCCNCGRVFKTIEQVDPETESIIAEKERNEEKGIVGAAGHKPLESLRKTHI
ncbi:hypothetical protein SAMN02746065_10916 [Desulfocicer vacuolatum DSM 3385]|uniref:Transcriptional repressor NrdR-like N-terminal domain-containing protein n=1 Tax=Desulfocicer vacuolatum DSM 3385 TaxID=1121400 RepID=A0A1W2BP22_9BACT|nr:hypothetical protein SAMN02746065_10916 [Desulfocicer vacuolatum DSM 3385]